MAHALLSPSSASRWMECHASIEATRHLPSTTNDAADEGTAAHWLAALCLARRKYDQGRIAFASTDRYIGRHIQVINGEVWEGGDAPIPPKLRGQSTDFHSEHEVTEEFASAVQDYIDAISAIANSGPCVVSVEQKVSITHLTGEEGAHGTADTVLEIPNLEDKESTVWDELIVVDLKFGQSPRGIVYAEDGNGQLNKQLGIYALGVMHDRWLRTGRTYKRIRGIIIQPRLNHVSEAVRSPGDMETFALQVRTQALLATGPEGKNKFAPGDDRCHFCLAFPTCAAAQAHAEGIMGITFDNLDEAKKGDMLIEISQSPGERLARIMPHLGFLDQWSRAVMRHGEALILENPTAVPGYKVVLGKKGHRKWADPQAAELVLQSASLSADEIYKKTLTTPTQIEKIAKARKLTIMPLLKDFISQAPPSRSVVPERDKREAITATSEDQMFQPIEAPTAPIEVRTVEDLA